MYHYGDNAVAGLMGKYSVASNLALHAPYALREVPYE